MPPQSDNDRIERLETRVDRLEDANAAHLEKIYKKLDELTVVVNKAAVRAAKSECPSPGACVQIGHDLTHAVKLLDAQTARVERLELKILDVERVAQLEFHKLEKTKAWILGAWTVASLIAAVIGSTLTILAGYFLNKL